LRLFTAENAETAEKIKNIKRLFYDCGFMKKKDGRQIAAAGGIKFDDTKSF